MLAWGEIMRKTARCGLGQTSANPIATTIKKLQEFIDTRVKNTDYQSEFDMQKAVLESCDVVGRSSEIHE